MSLFSQSPHGTDFKVNGAACHTSDGWDIPIEKWKFNERDEVKKSEMTDWAGGQDTLRFKHSKTDFPLTGQHTRVDCRSCHETMVFSEASPQCISCHTTEYQTAANPNHVLAGFSQNCVECHTTDLTWMPAKYNQHDAEYFPIYSGEHQGEWNQCTDCHTSIDHLNCTVYV